MSEWANFRSPRSSSGWSARGGQCRNPYILDVSPCGSSSGSAAAIAASLAAVAVGTETDGSIVCPASVNSVVGIKPTLGLVSRAGVIPIAHSQDTVGPFGRTVSDAAALLGVLAGADPRDMATMSGGSPRSQGDSGSDARDYSRYLDPRVCAARALACLARCTGGTARRATRSPRRRWRSCGSSAPRSSIRPTFPRLRRYRKSRGDGSPPLRVQA